MIDCSGGVGSYASLLVRSNGVVTHPGGSENGLWLQFTGNVDIEAGSRISADGMGYGSQAGPGGGASGAGGSHGGTGGYGGAAVYDSITAPSELGSGGGNTGAGGGGSGGAILLDVGAITGTGVLAARGGSCSGASYTYGGGGGGRISILYTVDTYTGLVHVHGGTGRDSAEARNGGPGTLYYKGSSESFGCLVFDNGTVVGWTLHPAFSMAGTNLAVRSGKVSFDCASTPVVVNNLHIGPAGVVSHPPESAQGLDIRAGGDAVIESDSQLNVDGKGYGSQAGPGGGASGAGGSHGGTGGYGGAAVYDDIVTPAAPGSGGGNTPAGVGGEGGGLIHLDVSGTLTLDGTVRANGLHYSNRSGGSGGAIYLAANSLAGSGIIVADGGTGAGGTSHN